MFMLKIYYGVDTAKIPGTTLRQPRSTARPVGSIGTDFWKVKKY